MIDVTAGVSLIRQMPDAVDFSFASFEKRMTPDLDLDLAQPKNAV